MSVIEGFVKTKEKNKPTKSDKTMTSSLSSQPGPTSPTPPPRSSSGSRTARQRPKKTRYQKKQRILLIGDSIAHNLQFRNVEEVTNTTVKTAKSYSSTHDTNARFPQKNMKNVSHKELKLAV